MFSSVRGFLWRHRRKFLVGGGVVGGLILLSKYAESKLTGWQKRQVDTLVRKQRHRQHYEKTRNLANATTLSLSSSITKTVSEELDVDYLISAISASPEKKRLIWDDLKIVGFSRCVATIYTAAVVGTVVHARLMLLGGYTFGDLNVDRPNVTATEQEMYLGQLQSFCERGLPSIISKIRQATKFRLRSLSLGQQISLEQLEGILKDIVLMLSGEPLANGSENLSFKLHPWSRFVPKMNPDDDRSEHDMLYQMTDEIKDILDCDDFNRVVEALVRNGLNHVIDHVAEFYPQSPVGNRVVKAMPANKDTEINNSTEDSTENSKGEQTAVNSLPNFSFNCFKNTTLVVPKLVPILSDVVRPCLSPAPGQLLQSVLLDEQLENLSFNIYEAFSV